LSGIQYLCLILEVVERHQILEIEIVFVGKYDNIIFFLHSIDDTFIIIENLQSLSCLDFSFEIVGLLDIGNGGSKSARYLEQRISWLDDILDSSIIVIIDIDGDGIHIDLMGDAVISLDEAGIYRQLLFPFGELVCIDNHKDKEDNQK
jgi:hypothetical protein